MAEKEAGVLQSLVDTLGPPNLEQWPDARTLPLWTDPQFGGVLESPPSSVERMENFKKKVVDRAGESAGLDLLLLMLQWNPRRRISAEDALNHPWFRTHMFGPQMNTLDMSGFRNQTHSISLKKKHNVNSKERPQLTAAQQARHREP